MYKRPLKIRVMNEYFLTIGIGNKIKLNISLISKKNKFYQFVVFINIKLFVILNSVNTPGQFFLLSFIQRISIH